ncbi:hypothetical protein [Mangrovimonas sp. DI 80]|uniref:hypothetical protein n=1 Tax=Mangrovimonas sp. DI 80 TaxID=1779330 RepID=UPI000F4F0C71|nr:hypothetical protein [Mangrovimonas sp. DI 80]
MNKSLIIQGIIAVSLIPITWITNKLNFKIGNEFSGATYIFIAIGVMFYLPALAFLNLIKLILQGKIENQKSK